MEQESSALADRLVRGQVNLAQETENCMSISNELLKLRDINSDAHRRLEEAYDTIRDLSCKVCVLHNIYLSFFAKTNISRL